MPHDKNGKAVKPGAYVMVKAKVESVQRGEYCNVTLKIGYEKDYGSDNVQSTLVLNAKQVELIEE